MVNTLLIRIMIKFGPLVLVVTGFLSILLGIIFHSISIDEIQFRSPPKKHFDPGVIIDDNPNNIIWFLQITDLHLSNRGDYDRQKDFQDFAKTYLDIIQPSAVLVTGDLTDGRKPNTAFDSGPQLEEWKAYNNAIHESKAENKTSWLDIRGNHDNFNVYNPSDINTLYRQYSIMGKTNERNYLKLIKDKEGRNYSFIGVDEVQSPGLKIPFNFLGIVADEDLNQLKNFKKVAEESNSLYSIWFAHYPTSSISSPHEGLRNIIDGPYLCGHYHTLGNLVNKMHSTQQAGFVELELGDWKFNRRIRLAAIDHQLFSMVDFSYKQFPIALMTNPKTAEHSMPKYEPIERIANSTHIRVIAFSNATIDRVSISIDEAPPIDMEHKEGHLYVMRWDPKLFSNGLHTATIEVSDSEKKTRYYVQTFSLDGSKQEFSFLARILLRAYFKTSVMSIFFFVVGVNLLPMLILRLIPISPDKSSTKRCFNETFLHRLHILTNINRVSFPLMLIPLWMAVGPLFIGYLVDEAIGVSFVWGVLIDGKFLHTGLTYNVGSLFLLLIHMPEIILISNQVGATHRSISEYQKRTNILNLRSCLHLIVTLVQLFMGYLLISAYGFLAYLTSFPYFWCLFIYASCWYQCTTLEKSDFPDNTRSMSQEEQPLTGRTATLGDKPTT